ncbi:hypothetical protein E2C01_045809 [Portunus trituberculatus]|uniref:Uncharacterized protein n=1 Tax=Portunus trituberculatus TaxID=210409 RepID=A0A5B7FZ95_PORTR|nr:hypothetical protein [Portunus trituberculatus]
MQCEQCIANSVVTRTSAMNYEATTPSLCDHRNFPVTQYVAVQQTQAGPFTALRTTAPTSAIQAAWQTPEYTCQYTAHFNELAGIRDPVTFTAQAQTPATSLNASQFSIEPTEKEQDSNKHNSGIHQHNSRALGKKTCAGGGTGSHVHPKCWGPYCAAQAQVKQTPHLTALQIPWRSECTTRAVVSNTLIEVPRCHSVRCQRAFSHNTVVLWNAFTSAMDVSSMSTQQVKCAAHAWLRTHPPDSDSIR